MKVEESINVTFDETPPPPKTSPLEDDDLVEEQAIEVSKTKPLGNDLEDKSLENNEIINIKESKSHPLENVIEPKNINEALKDESWVIAMQEELNQFISNDVWELVPNPKDMTIIGTKWVFRNKLDENGVVSRNKARLVAQGYNQQEGIDYDETYAPVARLESIRILLAYACALDFKLFQMDVKSAFLNGFINEEVYVAQPPGFIDFAKPNHVYRLKKALYGLKQAPKACGDKDEGEGAPRSLPTLSCFALPAVDHAPSAEETEPFKTDESAATPPPHHAYRIPSPSLPVSPLPLPASPTYPLGYRAAMIWASVAMLRAAVPSTYILAPRSEVPPSRTPPLLPIPLPTPSPPLLPPSTDGRANARVHLLPLLELMDDEIMRDLKRDVSYGITDTWDEMLVNMLVRDRCAHARKARLIEIKARMSREAWGRSMDTSDLACTEVMKMEPKKRTTRLNPEITTTTPATTSVTNAQLQAMIDQGVTAALAACDAIRRTNGEDSHNSGMGLRRNE
ncbi:retrovirus-related pol polyprotein from transposon TNT 1-94 [Tanacetum coccineum]